MTKLIKDYKAGKVKYGKVREYLGYQALEEDRSYRRNAKKLRESSIAPDQPMSAEDKYFETIAHMEVSDILESMVTHGIITEEKLSILSRYCVDLESQSTIAKDLRVSQQYIAKVIKGIREKCQEFIEESKEPNELLSAIAYRAVTTIPKSARKDAHGAKHKIRWPSEFLMKVSIDGQWSREKYVLKDHCVVPEYFSECFGDNETKCGLCHDEYGGSTCSRTEVNR